jgi:hypothetical protein
MLSPGLGTFTSMLAMGVERMNGFGPQGRRGAENAIGE